MSAQWPLILTICLTSLSACLDPTGALIDLELPLCTSSEIRARYTRDQVTVRQEDIRGVWSLQVHRCVFKSAQEASTREEWRALYSEPFIVDIDSAGDVVSIPMSDELTAPELSASVVIGDGKQLQSLTVNLGRLDHDRSRLPPLDQDTLLALRLEAGSKLVTSAEERERYQSDFEELTGVVSIAGQGQVGVFILTQHPNERP